MTVGYEPECKGILESSVRIVEKFCWKTHMNHSLGGIFDK